MKKGRHVSIKQKQKISDSVRKILSDPLIRQKMSDVGKGRLAWNKNRKWEEEVKEKIRKNTKEAMKKVPYKKLAYWKDKISPKKDKIYSKDGLSCPQKYQKVKEKLAGRKRPKRCKICKEFEIPSKKLCFDHNHKSGKFRSWICMRCNLILGQAKDDISLFKKLIKYLKKHE